ncbi:MAG: nucleoside monophosphate kinase [bacterium]|nr:nucleoside monophosphate kinase [bacterium]
MIKTFIFMGRPGSGKGKQAELLSEKTSFPIYSSGNEYRKIAEGSGFVADKVRDVLDAGGLQPAWLSNFLFQKTLLGLSSDDGIIFEGAGRKEPEARLFSEVCNWLGRDFRVLHIKVSEAIVAERLRKRQEIEGRKDDDPSVFQNRLKNFYEHTAPAIEYFRSINKVIDIDGEPLPDAVFAEVWQKVSSL